MPKKSKLMDGIPSLCSRVNKVNGAISKKNDHIATVCARVAAICRLVEAGFASREIRNGQIFHMG